MVRRATNRGNRIGRATAPLRSRDAAGADEPPVSTRTGFPIAAFLAFPILGGVWLTASVEAMSAFGLLGSRPAWAVFWLVSAAGALFLIPRLHRRLEGQSPSTVPRPPRWAVVVVGGILILTFTVAVVAPPNNWDSMAYHNARVMEWWDHGDLSYWYTPDFRQLSLPPLASYLKLALLGLTGNDWLFNLVQWCFFLVTIVAAYALVARLWPRTRSAPLGAVLVATIPLAILESTSTQNDVVVAGYWLVGAFFMWRAFEGSPPVPGSDFLLGSAAVGLSWLTKGTALVYTGPMLAVAVVIALERARRSDAAERRAWVRAALFGCGMALIVNVGPWARNWGRYESVLGPPTGAVKPAAYLKAGVAGAGRMVASQLLRSAALHLDSLRFVGLDSGRVVGVVAAAHRWLGMDLNDTALTFERFESIRYSSMIHEDFAGCTWPFLLACLTPVLALLTKRSRRDGHVWAGFALGWAAWIFCCVAVRWMPWNSRLQLPVMIWLMVPVAGVVGAADRFVRGTSVGMAFLVLAAIPALLFNATRPMISLDVLPASVREMLAPAQSYVPSSILVTSRWENYFRAQPAARQAVERVIRDLPPSCETTGVVGLFVREGSWETALWLGARRAGRDLHFRHIRVHIPRPDLCALITSYCPNGDAFCLDRKWYGGIE